MRINKSRFEKRKYVSSNLDKSVYDEFFELHPQWVEKRREVEALVDGYFEFLKLRLQSFDFLEYTFLNIGTFVSRPKKIQNAILKLREEEKNLKDEIVAKESQKTKETKETKETKKSYLYYFIPATITKLEKLQETYREIQLNGKIKRRTLI